MQHILKTQSNPFQRIAFLIRFKAQKDNDLSVSNQQEIKSLPPPTDLPNVTSGWQLPEAFLESADKLLKTTENTHYKG